MLRLKRHYLFTWLHLSLLKPKCKTVCGALHGDTKLKKITKSSNQFKQASKCGGGGVTDMGIGVGELLKENPAWNPASLRMGSDSYLKKKDLHKDCLEMWQRFPLDLLVCFVLSKFQRSASLPTVELVKGHLQSGRLSQQLFKEAFIWVMLSNSAPWPCYQWASNWSER